MSEKKFLIEFELNVSRRKEHAQILSGEKKASPAVEKMNQIKAAGRRRHSAAIASQEAWNRGKGDLSMPRISSTKTASILAPSRGVVVGEETPLTPAVKDKLSIEVGDTSEYAHRHASGNRSPLEDRIGTPTSQDRILQKLAASPYRMAPSPQSRKSPKLRPLSQGTGTTRRLHRIVAQLEKEPMPLSPSMPPPSPVGRRSPHRSDADLQQMLHLTDVYNIPLEVIETQVSMPSPNHTNAHSPPASSPSSPARNLNSTASDSHTDSVTPLAKKASTFHHHPGIGVKSRPVSAPASKSNSGSSSSSRPFSARPTTSTNRALLSSLDEVSRDSTSIANVISRSIPVLQSETAKKAAETKRSNGGDEEDGYYGEDFEDSMPSNNNNNNSRLISGEKETMIASSSNDNDNATVRDGSCREAFHDSKEAPTSSSARDDIPVDSTSSTPGPLSPMIAVKFIEEPGTPMATMHHDRKSSSFSAMMGHSNSASHPRSLSATSSSCDAKLHCPSFYRSAKGLERDIFQLEQVEAGHVTVEQWNSQQRGDNYSPSWDCRFGFGQSTLINQEIPKLGHEKRKEQLQRHLENLRKKRDERDAWLETERPSSSAKSSKNMRDQRPSSSVASPSQCPRQAVERKKRNDRKLHALLKEDDDGDDDKFI